MFSFWKTSNLFQINAKYESNNISWKCVKYYVIVDSKSCIRFLPNLAQKHIKLPGFSVSSQKISIKCLKSSSSMLADWTTTTLKKTVFKVKEITQVFGIFSSVCIRLEQLHHAMYKKQLHRRWSSMSSDIQQHQCSVHIHQSDGLWCEASGMMSKMKDEKFPIGFSLYQFCQGTIRKLPYIFLAIPRRRYRENFVVYFKKWWKVWRET